MVSFFAGYAARPWCWWAAAFLLLDVVCAQLPELGERELPLVTLKGVSEMELKDVNEVVEQNMLLHGEAKASAPLADDLAFFLRQHYESRGFTNTYVSWELRDGGIFLHVAEGARLAVGEVVILGVPVEMGEVIEEYLMRTTRERYGAGRGADPLPYVERDVLAGSDLALRYLLSLGYVEARTGAPEVTRAAGGAVDMRMSVELGVLWKFSRVSVSGLPAGFSKEVAHATEGMGGASFSAARMENARSQIEGVLHNAGYFTASVEAIYVKEPGVKAYAVSYVVKAGGAHRIARVVPREGLSAGAARVIRGSFQPEIGRVYRTEQLDIAFRRVLDTEMFEELRTELVPEGGEVLSVFVDGEETNRYTFGLFGGFDTFQGVVLGGSVQATHLPKPGDLLRAEVETSARGVNGTLSWIDPAVFESPYEFQLDLKSNFFTFEGYELYSAELLATLQRKFTREIRGSVYAGVSMNVASSETLTESQLGPDGYQVGRVGATVRYDGRNSPLSPRDGLALSLGVELAQGAGDVSFAYMRSDASAVQFFTLTKKWRGYVGVRYAVLAGANVLEVPIDLRLFNGGMNSVRGFKERMMGGHARDGTPLGGTQTGVATVEFMREMYPNLEWAVFYDAGYVGGTESVFVPESMDLRHSVGMGVRYQLPFGPMRLDYAVNLNPEEGEPFGTLHFGFGFSW